MHRSYHALPPLTTRDGELVNAVYGFCSILMTILTQEKPKYIAAAFDTAAPTFRHEVYKEYKAGRVKAPDEFYDQIPRIEQILENLNIPILRKDGVEADDIIGTIVTTNEKKYPEMNNKIVTSDMDAMQLVSKKTCVGNLHKGYKASQCFFPKDVEEKYGLRPDQITDLKGIQGDNSDNIPGVKGIGKVGATQLLQSYKNLEGVYKKLEEIKGKKRELLEEQKEQAFFSRELATIKKDVKTEYKLKNCKAHDFDLNKVIELFDSLQFYSLIRRLNEWRKSDGIKGKELSEVFDIPKKQAAKEKAPSEQASLF